MSRKCVLVCQELIQWYECDMFIQLYKNVIRIDVILWAYDILIRLAKSCQELIQICWRHIHLVCEVCHLFACSRRPLYVDPVVKRTPDKLINVGSEIATVSLLGELFLKSNFADVVPRSSKFVNFL